MTGTCSILVTGTCTCLNWYTVRYRVSCFGTWTVSVTTRFVATCRDGGGKASVGGAGTARLDRVAATLRDAVDQDLAGPSFKILELPPERRRVVAGPGDQRKLQGDGRLGRREDRFPVVRSRPSQSTVASSRRWPASGRRTRAGTVLTSVPSRNERLTPPNE